MTTGIVDLSQRKLTDFDVGGRAASGPPGTSYLRRGWVAAALVVGLAVLQPAVADEVASASPAAATAVERAASPALERRMKLLSKELDLTPGQQVTVRRILEEQHEAVQRVWSNTELPPEERTVATRAVAERTADRIRTVLTDQQRKKYNAPRPQSREGTPEKRLDVQAWLDAARDKQAGGLPEAERFDPRRVDSAGR